MNPDIIATVCFGAVGLLLGAAAYMLASRIQSNEKPYISIIIRQGINIAYLCAAYFTAPLFGAQASHGLLGAAVGIVLSSAFGRRINEKNEDDKND